jgi:hypothetical protein
MRICIVPPSRRLYVFEQLLHGKAHAWRELLHRYFSAVAETYAVPIGARVQPDENRVLIRLDTEFTAHRIRNAADFKRRIAVEANRRRSTLRRGQANRSAREPGSDIAFALTGRTRAIDFK